MNVVKSCSSLLLLVLLLASGFASAARPLTPIDPPREAATFTLRDTLGNPVSLADYRGKVVVINFWATWCPPCRREMPSLNRAAAWLKQYDIELLAINSGEQPERVEKFLRERTLDFPVVLDPNSDVSAEWKATRLPMTYVVDPEGRLVYRALGSREWDAPELLEPIRSLALQRQ